MKAHDLIKLHHPDATPVRYGEICEGDVIARPVRDTYVTGTAHKKTGRRWTTPAGEALASSSHRGLYRLNRNHEPPNVDEHPLILAYHLTCGVDGTHRHSAKGWRLRITELGYTPVDGAPIHGDEYFLPEEIHDWAPAQITPAD
ncbi:hypothetical protein [Zhihengliuella halotolerans]|uniref:hypothetical protein n=1 Tax=Zhihengliuella halotolerans TaxID=370736 RepID=UPI000C80DAC3|nr:hypothetical protein [Zhihengliuella halotolerans]